MVERRRFQEQKKSADVLQKHYRAHRLGQRERARFLSWRKSAVLIQVRHLAMVLKLNIYQSSICVIKRCLSQREVRAYQSRKRNLQTRAALKIQVWFRGCRARRAYESKRRAIATVCRCLQTRFQRLR